MTLEEVHAKHGYIVLRANMKLPIGMILYPKSNLSNKPPFRVVEQATKEDHERECQETNHSLTPVNGFYFYRVVAVD